MSNILRRSARKRKQPMQPDELAQPAPVPSTSRGNNTTRDHEEQTTQSIGAVAQPQVSVPVANCLDPANANNTTGLWDLGNTPINVEVLEEFIKDYDKPDDKSLFMSGFKEGFRLNYTGPRSSVNCNNLVSAEINRSDTLEKLNKEVTLGRMVGPYTSRPISNLRISPIGLVEKSDKSWRLITHLSYPTDNGVNSFISEELCSVRYSNFDNVIDLVSSLGKGALLGQIDIKSAFRLLIVNPADFDLLGIMFDGKYYVDKCLPMGCSILCSLFEKFATFLHWVVERKSGFSSLDHYLDDFFFAGPPSSNQCKCLMDCFESSCGSLGVPIAEHKTEGLCTKLTVLGLLIDSEEMMVKIPEVKLHQLRIELSFILSHRRIKLRKLESVLGLMAFCTRAIPAGRAFLRRFCDLVSGIKNRKPYYSVKITKETKADAQVWLDFLKIFIGECYLPERFWSPNETIKLFTDRTGNPDLGCGAFFDGRWVQFRWPALWSKQEFMKDMSFLEFVPVLLACLAWKDNLRDKKIIFNIDNKGLVVIVNKRTSKSKDS